MRSSLVFFLIWHRNCGDAVLFAGPQFGSAKKSKKGRVSMTIFKKLVLPALAGILLLAGLTACEREGPMERAGEKVDETVEKAGDKVERATDK
jgi:hyperosmotically inducible protein